MDRREVAQKVNAWIRSRVRDNELKMAERKPTNVEINQQIRAIANRGKVTEPAASLFPRKPSDAEMLDPGFWEEALRRMRER